MTVLTPFLERLEAAPAHPALIGPDGAIWSREALDREAAAVAAAHAARGIGPGDRVLVALPVAPPLFSVLLGLWRLGAVAIFPEPGAGLDGVRHAIAATGPKAHVAPWWLSWPAQALLRGLGPRLPTRGDGGRAPVAEMSDAAPALITFTSGSTGRPKGIVRSHGFLRAQLDALAPLLREETPRVDMVSLPLFLLAGLALGNTGVLPAGSLRRPGALPAARLLEQLRRHRVERLVAPPSICRRLAATGERLPLQRILTGGGPVFPDLIHALLAAAPEARLTAVYGSSEAEPIAHLDLDRLSATDWRVMEGGGGLPAGPPVPGIDLRLVADEIQVAGPMVNPGYLDPADDAANKLREGGRVWHRTGDAGRLDAAGGLWLLGRLEGRADGLFPFAVETAALAWPGVRQAALLALPGQPTLVLAGDAAHRPDWARRAVDLGMTRIEVLPQLPLDRRHNAKIDYAALRRLMAD